jgi:hypothetical protein
MPQIAPRGWRVILGATAVLAIPVAAEAHAITGSGGWTDELVCLVPAGIMLALVVILGRTPASRGKGGPVEQPGTSSTNAPATNATADSTKNPT